jgi:transketolase
MQKRDYKEIALQVRRSVLCMTHDAKASHVGACLSIVDILAVLYGSILKVDSKRPDWSDRDRFILSKGHGGAALYAVLAESGFFPKEWLDTYCQDGSKLSGHVTCGAPGVEVSTGALGHGLSIGCGMALVGNRERLPYRVFVLMSDGECDEGSIWEAALFAAHHHLDNLIAIIDYNKLQAFGAIKEILNLEPFTEKWKAFNWAVREIDGHNHKQIEDTLNSAPFENGKPSIVIAHTIKGKGVSFMENQLAWHYKSPNNEQLAQALAELEGCK